RAAAAQRASRAVGAPAVVSPRPIAIVFTSYEGRDAVLRGATAVNAPWMGDVIAYSRNDATLSAAAANATIVDSGAYDARFTVLARTESGRPAALAARAQIDGRDRLVLMPLVDAGSLVSAALMSAALHALANDVPGTESEQRTLADDVIARWQRPTTVDVAASDITPMDSDGRWLWVVALALLGVETFVRRRVRAPEAVA
ncbi:MAG TPA: hypothetical protein VJR92_00945, partial [Gemmatimonadaceae bacterium]|nr:hypothetical protein [Gemmatimonadaceae bacterium]